MRGEGGYFFLAPRGETRRAPVQSLPALTVEVCCRPGRRRGLADLARLDVAVAAGLRGQQPHHAVVGEGAQGIGEQFEQVTVAVAVPEQHRVDHLVGVLVDQLADAFGQGVTEVFVDVVVVAHLHDHHVRLEAEPVRQAAYAVGLTSGRAHCRSSSLPWVGSGNAGGSPHTCRPVRKWRTECVAIYRASRAWAPCVMASSPIRTCCAAGPSGMNESADGDPPGRADESAVHQGRQDALADPAGAAGLVDDQHPAGGGGLADQVGRGQRGRASAGPPRGSRTPRRPAARRPAATSAAPLPNVRMVRSSAMPTG